MLTPDRFRRQAIPCRSADLQPCSIGAVQDGGVLLRRAHQALAETVNQLAIRFRERVEKAIDCAHHHAPLRLAGDGTHRIESALEFGRNTDAKLRIITNFLAVPGSSRRTPRTTAASRAIHAEPLCKPNSSPDDARAGATVASHEHVSASASTDRDPRDQQDRSVIARGPDRRRHSRSGRRNDDPHVSAWHWRRVAFFFGAYAAYVSLRTLPATVRKWFKKPTVC